MMEYAGNCEMNEEWSSVLHFNAAANQAVNPSRRLGAF
jgi:hypothetical protein